MQVSNWCMAVTAAPSASAAGGSRCGSTAAPAPSHSRRTARCSPSHALSILKGHWQSALLGPSMPEAQMVFTRLKLCGEAALQTWFSVLSAGPLKRSLLSVGQEVVSALQPAFYRAPTDNDRGGAGGSAYASRRARRPCHRNFLHQIAAGLFVNYLIIVRFRYFQVPSFCNACMTASRRETLPRPPARPSTGPAQTHNHSHNGSGSQRVKQTCSADDSPCHC